ncbi:MAG TPA: phosphoribosyltransferase family protein [Chromobacteriaceae bacterium]|nr:phosphoribosyltransferase family protein [Chromobacteriaceae bacterium]
MMRFQNREQAAQLLAAELAAWRGKHALVLAIPRGGVPMGRIVADALEGELDVVLVRKIGAPHNPEFAIGAVSESGWSQLSDDAVLAGASERYVQQERELQLEVIRQRRAQYRLVQAPISPTGRNVIVLDDGLATGATMLAALHAVRASRPQWLICAVPVASLEALAQVRRQCDEVVCLHATADFHAVGQFYLDFPQVEDSAAVAALAGRPAAGE